MQAAQHRKLNTREAAEYLGISASTLAKLRVYAAERKEQSLYFPHSAAPGMTDEGR